MSHKPKRYNGIKRRNVLRARIKILREAKKNGFITNAKAKEVSKFSQVWFHLNAMAGAGMLEHTGYNTWEPAKRSRKSKVSPYAVGPRH